MSFRNMRILFWCLLVCILVMGTVLFVEHIHARDRVRDLASQDETPLDAPGTGAEAVTLDLANDDEGSITAADRQLALPPEVNARARALLDHLLTEYALPGSTHPLPPGVMVNEIFLLPLPIAGHAVDNSTPSTPDGRVQNHPCRPH